MLNNAPMDWHSKKQHTAETATCSSEHSSSRNRVERTLDLRIALRHLGVLIRKLRFMFGDNASMVNSIMTTQGKIHNSHVALSFHRVR